MKRIAAALLLLFLGSGARAAPESLDAIEKDLSAILSEMDAVRAELDRIAEHSSVPRATGVRVEIHGTAGAAAPAGVHLLVGGRVEDEREFGKAERDAFAAGSSPLVVEIPLLPGSYQARIELSHPYWKNRPSADFPLAVTTGATAVFRFRFSAPGAGGSPTLSPIREK
jgi:hypothetical protein